MLVLAFCSAMLMAQPPAIEFSCPMDPEVRSLNPGKCAKCGMRLEAGIREQIEYPLSLNITPAHIPAEEKLDLDFRVSDPKTGKPVTEFELVHEKLFHLFIVSQDLEHFEHVHPEPAPDGSFHLSATLPQPGYYRLLADFYPKGGVPQLTPKTIATAGYARGLEPATLRPDLAPQHGENLDVELTVEPPQPIAGFKTLLFFKLKPGDGLEPYLGAWGHLLAASSDLIDTIHAHPSIADGGPQVQFDVFFAREATYRIWVQLQRKGKVNTVSFTIPVSRLK